MNPSFLLSAVGLVFLLATYGVQTSEDVVEDTLRDLEARVGRIENYLELDNKVETQTPEEEKEKKSEEGGTSASTEEEEEEDEGAAEYGESADKMDGDISEDAATFRAGGAATKFWPEGKIHFELDKTSIPSIPEDPVNKPCRMTTASSCLTNITKALKEIEMKTMVGRTKCIEFIEKPDHRTRDYIFITKKDGCWSKVGCKSGKQELSIGFSCCSVGVIMHEALHAIGYYHEQARVDRDNAVEIVWSNIKPGWDSNFQKQPSGGAEKYKDTYDLRSIMHYGSHAYSKGNKDSPFKTIVLKKPSNVIIGQRKMLSDQDIKGIRKMYKCTGAGSGIPANSCSSSSYTSGRTFSSFSRTRTSSTRPASGSRPTRPTYQPRSRP